MPPPSKEDTFRILIASDIHLGYMENDPIRGNDSVVTFEEILSIAKEQEVDLILHGGDLFHENKPSRPTLHACLALLRQYCMGDKAVQFEYLSDQSHDFKHCKFPGVNYEDPNLNVSIPMFSIHGNHDDPTGQGNLCSLDLLHTAGFVNYFGKATSLDKIQISPLLLQKGGTKLALYGLGSVRDERLHRMFLKKDVSMLRPKESQDQWFNLFVLHQNRVKHSVTSYIPEQFLEDFLDLVIWGHEHECRLNVSPEKVEWNPIQKLYVCQPGSSIATSLSEGEKVPKHVGLLQICGKEFQMQSIPLKSVRQFYMEDVVLSASIPPESPKAQQKCEAFCKEKVNALIAQAENEHSDSPKQPRQPLIRLRVDYTGFEPFSTQRFGQNFVDKVANPTKMIHFQRQKQDRAANVKNDPDMLAQIKAVAVDSARVEDMVAKLISKEGFQLKLLSEKGMNEAVKEFVDKEEREAIRELVKYQLKKTQGHLQNSNTREDQIHNAVIQFKEERKSKKGEVEEEVREALKEAVIKRESQASNGGNNTWMSDEEDNNGEDAHPSSRGRGRGRGGRGRGRGRGRGSSTNDNEFDSSSASSSARGTRGSGRGQSKRGAKSSVVETTGRAWTLHQHFSVSASSSSRNRQQFYDDTEEDLIVLDDDSNDEWNMSADSRSNSSSGVRNARQGTKKSAVIYDDDSEVEVVQPRKRRK